MEKSSKAEGQKGHGRNLSLLLPLQPELVFIRNSQQNIRLASFESFKLWFPAVLTEECQLCHSQAIWTLVLVKSLFLGVYFHHSPCIDGRAGSCSPGYTYLYLKLNLHCVTVLPSLCNRLRVDKKVFKITFLMWIRKTLVDPWFVLMCVAKQGFLLNTFSKYRLHSSLFIHAFVQPVF